MISSVSRPERDQNPEKSLPLGPSDNASFDPRSRLARESRHDFTLWLKTADRQRHPAQRQATRKRTAGTSAPRRSAASCSAATPLNNIPSATSQNLLLGVTRYWREVLARYWRGTGEMTSDNFDFQNSFRTHAARHGIRSASSTLFGLPTSSGGTSGTTCRIHLSSPKPGHPLSGAERGGAELATLGSARRPRRLHSWHLCLPKNHSNSLNIPLQARTKEFQFKLAEEQNLRLTTGFSAVYHRDEKRSSFLDAH